MHQIILHDFTFGGRKVAPHNAVPGVLRGASNFDFNMWVTNKRKHRKGTWYSPLTLFFISRIFAYRRLFDYCEFNLDKADCISTDKAALCYCCSCSKNTWIILLSDSSWRTSSQHQMYIPPFCKVSRYQNGPVSHALSSADVGLAFAWGAVLPSVISPLTMLLVRFPWLYPAPVIPSFLIASDRAEGAGRVESVEGSPVPELVAGPVWHTVSGRGL